MEDKEKKEGMENIYHFIILFIVALIAGYWLKMYLKPVITASPDDRSSAAVKQSFDFEAAKQRLEEKLQKEGMEQSSSSQGSCG